MDKTIDDLLAAEAVTADDLFLAQQNGTAKKVSGDTLRRYLGMESGLPKPDSAEDGAFLRIRNNCVHTIAGLVGHILFFFTKSWVCHCIFLIL